VGVVGVRASGGRIAAIGRADVAVVAVRGSARLTAPAAAGVARGAGVPVAARVGVVGVGGTSVGLGTVVCADVAGVAVSGLGRLTAPAAAGVARGEGVPVAARVGVVGVRAAGGRIAAVGRTDVAVVAVRGPARLTAPAAAGVARGAGVPVAARVGVVG